MTVWYAGWDETKHTIKMESISGCESVLSVAELIEQAIFILSANRKYFDCLRELQRTVINKSKEPKDRS